MTLTREFHAMAPKEGEFYSIVDPLDDEREEKVDTEHLGLMQMTKTVRLCLFALRGYLLLMFGLLGYRVLQLAGVIGA